MATHIIADLSLFDYLTIICLIGIGAVGNIVTTHTATQLSGAAYTLQLCQASHLQLNGSNEAACGAAQDKYHVEFLCTANTIGGDSCWVEVR